MTSATIENETLFKYRRYFNRSACLSVCLLSVFFLLSSVLEKHLEIGLVIIGSGAAKSPEINFEAPPIG